MTVNDNKVNPFLAESDDNRTTKNKKKRYNNADYIIIIITVLITLFGFIFRTWRLIREGMPATYDGYFFLKRVREVYFSGWMDLSAITRDPPGLTFILVMAEYLLGLAGEPIIWSLYLFPQLICSIQLIIFYVLARRLTKSRTIGLLTMLVMSFVGLIVYRNQNVAPEIVVLGMVPFVVFYLYRYLETNDWRHMLLAILTTITITLVHHLTTFIVVVIWHVVLPFDILYRRLKSKTVSIKYILINVAILLGIDAFISTYWIFGLTNFPFKFIGGAFSELFIGINTASMALMIFSLLLLAAVGLAILFYNFEHKKINILIIVAINITVVVIFIITMFFGGTSPDQTIIAGLVAGTPAFVLPPLLALGLISIPKLDIMRSRVMRGWAVSIIAVVGVTAIFPGLSSLLSRIALYAMELCVLAAAMGVIWILKKVNKRKWKAVALIGLIATTGLTMSFAYPKPEYNWGQQEVYWDAEFSAIDYMVYGEGLEYPQWIEGQNVIVDCDFRLGAIVMGYGSLASTFYKRDASWLKYILFANDTLRDNIVVTTSPLQICDKINYVFISDVMFDDAYMLGWASYGSGTDDWLSNYPEIRNILPLNPFMHRIYDTKISTVFLPFASP
ncbi:MAG: glycosyltransferase family 39 protein [Candidatus Heimdallarchaeota archaeon]